MNKFILIIFCLFLGSCAVTRKLNDNKIKINFLDEFVLAPDQNFKNTQVGGLSGIDYDNDQYYMVSDQASDPRIYIADIHLQNQKIDSIRLTGMISVSAPGKIMDLEAIRVNSAGELIIASEGMIQDKSNPGIYKVSGSGEILKSFSLPDYFTTSGEQKPRTNGVFEGLTTSYDENGYWVATELPLEKDGPKPKLYPTRSHIRLTKFDTETGKPVRQFVYKLDGISKLPINYFAINGVTEILQYEKDKFLIMERAYSAGYGSRGNTVKIFDVDASGTTNTLEMSSLKGQDYQMAEKSLIFNFKSVKNQLTDKIIDNLEGMCFGPDLPNGNKSLIVLSDNNFNSFAEQLNQFILLELDFKD